MERVIRDSDITLASRFEYKYVVSPLLVPAIREFVQPFVRPDRFAARRSDRRYAICSLYLDSDDLRLYQQTVGGEKNRFKLRVRSYSDDDSTPLFFEVKRKINNIVQKQRARVRRGPAEDLLERCLERSCGENDPDLEQFVSHMDLTAARPVIRVRYMREAYESIAGDPVRITLDTELMHVCTFDFDTNHTSGRWVTTPIDGVILEIKFTEMFPSWIRDLVQIFGLKQRPVPKYVMSVDHMMLQGREAVLSLGGFTLPVRRG